MSRDTSNEAHRTPPDAPRKGRDTTRSATPVIGLGASAGGIDAFQHFFDHAAPDLGFAYVVILHLAPTVESHLSEIMAPHTDMPVGQVVEPVEIEPNRVYVIKPGTILTLKDGKLLPETLENLGTVRRTPIDHFLFSLARERGERAAGVIMSGTGSDGTLGMRAIKEYGGLCLVQTPETAAHGGMTTSAIATGLIDQVLDVEEMPSVLANFFARLDHDQRRANKDGVRPDVIEALPAITRLLAERTRQDFSDYKRPTLARRVQRRMQATAVDDPGAYIERLRQDTEEPDRLFRELLIGVTEFFREPKSFDALREGPIRKLFENRKPDDPVRVWVAGCASGEEAYTVAMLMLEEARQLEDPPNISVFASDIDKQALNIGRRGRYPASSLEHVPEALTQRYFDREDDVFIVREILREQVLFCEHNMLRDPPFSQIDLVSCRNLLIYLETSMQERVLQIFHYALKEQGYLFLGSSETVGHESSRFQPLDGEHRIYGLRPGAERVFPQFPLIATPEGRGGARFDRARRARSADLQRLVERTIIDRFGPAWVVIDRDMSIRHFSKGTGRYLEPPAGKPTSDLLSMANDDLSASLRSAITQLLRTGKRVVQRGVATGTGTKRQRLDLEVDFLQQTHGADEQFCLITFREAEPVKPEGQEDRTSPTDVPRDESDLQRELRETRENLKTTSDELEVSNENLKASNEELASMNEELQSANEELETSKEELQSSNEELQTVNAELQQRVAELARTNDDLRNLFENTSVAMLFVDKDVRVRSFTPPLGDIFHVVETDKGRPLAHIAHRLSDEAIVEEIRGVIQNLQRVEREIKLKDGTTVHIMRIQPYRTLDNRIEGATITFWDVTNISKNERQLAESENHKTLLLRELQHRVKNILANVRGLATQTYKECGDLDQFYESFEGRLQALGRAQGLLGAGLSGYVDLKDLILEEFLAHAASVNDNVEVDGPDLLLEPRAAQMLGLAIHELATNAVKYGALLSDEGRISVSWHVEERKGAPYLVLDWQEEGIALDEEIGASGFGRRLLEEGLPFELGGQCRLEFPKDGCHCTMEIPFNGRIKYVNKETGDTSGREL